MKGWRDLAQTGSNKKAKTHYRQSLLNAYLKRWLESIVTSHIARLRCAEHYYNTNCKFKVIYGLKTIV